MTVLPVIRTGVVAAETGTTLVAEVVFEKVAVVDILAMAMATPVAVVAVVSEEEVVVVVVRRSRHRQ